MIRDYQDFLVRRWNELDMPARIRAAADNEDTQKPVQVPWLVQVVGELRHTTMHEGRQHPDVGLLFKDAGNLFNAGNGLTIATDIICVRDTTDAGEVTDPRAFAIVDCIVSVNRHDARPGWLVHGLASAADAGRFREPPIPPKIGGGTDVVHGGGGGVRPPETIDSGAVKAMAQIAALLQEMRTAQEAQRAIQERMMSELEGLRRDVNNAGRLLGGLIAGGGLGNLGGLIKP